ncbi:Crp/Fnr family transcriptional regulator [Phaeobacter porticola]|uniref:Anaerobic regulatory protein n=1 Tax=Phaeobacter porticola TaxID=1844006 RepID=A0A1L3I5M8_9RHOB|nr:Crp/Fnr family transcriptional regulator [Phaeobacter porticola]APG47416.1 Anaerobic regulatory protein [Phaeobacter porticola]
MNLTEFVEEHGSPLTKEAEGYIFRMGDRDRSLYIVQSGLLKAYYLSADGKENIKSFLVPGDSIGSITSAYADKGCTFSLMCLQDCKLICVEFDAVLNESKNDSELSTEIIKFLLGFAMKKEAREYELLCLSAEDRYRRLVDTRPEIFDLVTQIDIARYLGVTPVGLSRIKKRVSATPA